MAAQKPMELKVRTFGAIDDLNRPCVECGLITGNYCETLSQVGHPLWQGGICLASERIPSEKWQQCQSTPLCCGCEILYGACRFCRGVHGCTQPTK